MVVLLALAAAVGWGATDYLGGNATRGDRSVLLVLATSQLLGVLLLLPALIAHATPPPVTPGLLFAGLAGVAVTVELSLTYRALSRDQAFITAPVGALGATIAVTIGLIGGDPLNLAIAAGLLCALTGGGISAWASPTAHSATVIQIATLCLGAAVAVGAALTCLHAAGRLDPYWATTTEHLSTGLSAGFASLIGNRRSLRPIPPNCRQLPPLALLAAVGVGSDLAYVTASHHGALSIVSAIASLYPLTTIALGRLIQGHKASRSQLAGITLALLGTALLGATMR